MALLIKNKYFLPCKLIVISNFKVFSIFRLSERDGLQGGEAEEGGKEECKAGGYIPGEKNCLH